MSRVCQLCGKGSLKGNLVPRGIGRRVTKRTISRQQPNLREKRLEIGGRRLRVRMCTSCLSMLNKANKANKAETSQTK
ncbi:TPA: 50S ribosomal protein L28 [candidate division WWE3 bacterium]|uniref:Large ribosomal subunit protein bL28 n=1 Tax=candidate division WWE3 bacterium TaxID=2053526 RepID=A0A351JST9_UNCKA|nr:50S ribosomal protein L28 [candidate division WWE3 bacterium]